jgi:hypothetical protein
MKEHFSSALSIAKYLENHPAVIKVLHPMLPSHPDHELALKQHKGNKLFGFKRSKLGIKSGKTELGDHEYKQEPLRANYLVVVCTFMLLF